MASLACSEAAMSLAARNFLGRSTAAERACCSDHRIVLSFPKPSQKANLRQTAKCGPSVSIRGSRLITAVATSPAETGKVLGENPDWNDSDYIAVGLAHCFLKDDNSKLSDFFVIEPIPAGALECMENGGVTAFKCVTGSTLGVALRQDLSLLPEEFKNGTFCEEFDFRAKCASRTWKRQHPQENLMHLAKEGVVRSDFNFNLDDKRVMNAETEVKDSDNIKQDMSIDVYGRKDEEGGNVEKLYNA